MTRAVIQFVAQDKRGDIVPGAAVEIRDATTGALVQVWNSRTGGSLIGNPGATDSGGQFKGYINPARVNVHVEKGSFSRTWSDVAAYDVQGYANAAEGHYDAMRGIFYGAYAADPVEDPNGDPPNAGDWYFNTVSDRARMFNGDDWENLGDAPSDALARDNNLSDLTDPAAARANLGITNLLGGGLVGRMCTSNWRKLTTSSARVWYGVAYSPDLDVAVAVGDNVIAYSSPLRGGGESFVDLTNPSSGVVWSAVVWVSDLSMFVAVGSQGCIATSGDGESWTVRRAANVSNDDLTAVCWSDALSLLIAVGASATILSSTNGTSWTSESHSASDVYELSGVAWAGGDIGMFVAIGSAYDEGTDSNYAAILTSPDGETWTQRTPPADIVRASSVAYSPELGRVVASAHRDPLASGNVLAIYSDDGVNWTTASQAPRNATLTIPVIWVAEFSLFVIVGGRATASSSADPCNVFISDDGDVWFAQKGEPIGSSHVWSAVAWAAAHGKLIAVAAGTWPGNTASANGIMLSL